MQITLKITAVTVFAFSVLATHISLADEVVCASKIDLKVVRTTLNKGISAADLLTSSFYAQNDHGAFSLTDIFNKRLRLRSESDGECFYRKNRLIVSVLNGKNNRKHVVVTFSKTRYDSFGEIQLAELGAVVRGYLNEDQNTLSSVLQMTNWERENVTCYFDDCVSKRRRVFNNNQVGHITLSIQPVD